MEPLVSILIPAYNAEPWIAETLASALQQTWPRKEIIVVDDGSTDGTLAVARRFEIQGVQVVTQRNQGAAAARNRAFELSKGDYIQWLDADDLLAPDKIARQMDVLAQSSDRRALVSSSWGWFFHRQSQTKFCSDALCRDLLPGEWLLCKMRDNLFMANSAWLVSRELTEAAGPWDTLQLTDDDGEYFCRVLLQSTIVRFVPAARVYYRRASRVSLSHIGHSAERRSSQWRSMQLHVKRLLSLDSSEEARAACVAYIQLSLEHFYEVSPEIVDAADKLAGQLGGCLQQPQLSWKFAWLASLFGWSRARHIQLSVRESRKSVARFWDKMLFGLERFRLRKAPAQSRRSLICHPRSERRHDAAPPHLL